MAENETTGYRSEDTLTAEIFPPARSVSIRNNLRLLTAATMVVASLAVGYTLYALASIVVPLVLAFVVTYLVSPLVSIFAGRLRLGRLIGVILAMLIALGFVFVVGYLLFYSVSEAITQWPTYEARFGALFHSVVSWLQVRGVIAEGDFRADIMQWLPQKAGGLVMGALGRIMGLAGAFVMVLLFVFFMLTGRPARETSKRNGVFAEIDDQIKRYLLVKAAVSAVTGILVGLSLALIGLDMAVLFGLLAFLLNFIPTFGSMIATVLPFLLALVQFTGWGQPLLVLLIPSTIQVIIGNFLEPRIMGDQLHIHPVVILFSLVLWGLIWGVPGMLMAAPLTAILKIIFSRIETLKPVAGIIEGRLP